MAYTLDELTAPLTSEQVKTKIYAAIAARGVDTTAWQVGAPTRTVIAAFAIIVAAFSSLVALLAKSGFAELAAGAWLALKARYDYAEEKRYAAFATGQLRLSNTGGGVFSEDAFDVTFVNPETGRTYRNTGAFSLNPGNVITIPIQATEAGALGTSAPGAISAVVSPSMAGVVVTNLTAVVGSDDEDDAELRQRCSEKLGSLSPNGPWDAFTYAARNARRADGTFVGVKRVRILKDGFGRVDVYVASDSGAISGTRTNPATDLGAVDVALQHNAASITDTASAVSASNVVVPVTYQAFMYNTSGLTQAQILARISGALAEFFRTQPISGNILSGDPGKLFTDAIRSAITATLSSDVADAARLPIFHVTLSLPAADVVLGVGDVPVLGTVTGTVVQIPPNEGAL